ncbi:MAG: hypothetical protein RIQ94_2462, partial [Pseudomonadota bacterium]
MSFTHNVDSELAKLPDELRNSLGIMLKQWDEQLATLNL